jgi:dephospho-CoA kinase
MKVGLTGGIGCGKSTVVAFFREAGWRTVESDQVVRELLDHDAGIQGALRQRWGAEIFLTDGTTDRAKIAGQVFQNEAELRWLEALLHPRVREVWQGAIEAEPGADWLIEIPLLFEKSLETVFDFTVCISSPPAVVESRMAARGYTAEEVDRRRQRQMPLEEKMRRADFVITNAGSLEFLEQQTGRLIAQITENDSSCAPD